MDIVFDIDGTLADANHRLHFIKDPLFWIGTPPRPNWAGFLDDELTAKDAAIPQTWELMQALLSVTGNRIIFITGRNETCREMTYNWLTDETCPVRAGVVWKMKHLNRMPTLYMRSKSDRRPSDVSKRESLHRARADGYDPKLVFEDRKEDTAMWRSEGLLCCQVAEGDY
jgi:hypothetical protein